ncbi:hypothetical protein JS562_55120, partial [Agrobacterium sp. S2]|nr:hypothetical protein [Agrobacterium sp. S2]
TFHERALDPERARVVLLFHEATRTGAPVLGWNILVELQKRHDVIAVLMSGGELLPAIRDVAAATVLLDTSRPWDHFEADLLANHLAERYAPVYAIANSSATHVLVPGLEHAGVPTVALVHEFASSMPPIGILDPFYASASEIVFPRADRGGLDAGGVCATPGPHVSRDPRRDSLCLPPSAAEEPDAS